MNWLHGLCYLLVGAAGTAVVLTRDPRRQAIVLGLYGMIMAVLFIALQAPDVALSEVAVGAAAVPLMILVALANAREAPAGGGAREGPP